MILHAGYLMTCNALALLMLACVRIMLLKALVIGYFNSMSGKKELISLDGGGGGFCGIARR